MAKPTVVANIVVIRYMLMVLYPIRESLVISVRLEIPFTRETNIRGTAMSFSSLRKIVPQGSIQLIVNFSHPSQTDISPQSIPSPIPINILTQSGSFFSMKIYINSFYFSALYNISTGCRAMVPVPSLIWCLQLVPGAAIRVSSEASLTAGKSTSPPTFMERS